MYIGLKNLLFFTFLALFFPAAAQIQTGDKTQPDHQMSEVKQGGKFLAEIRYQVQSADTAYTLIFRNADYQYALDLVFVHFSGQGGALGQLRGLLLEAIDGGPDYRREIKLGDTDLAISNKKKSVFIYTQKGFVVLTRAQVDKLLPK